MIIVSVESFGDFVEEVAVGPVRLSLTEQVESQGYGGGNGRVSIPMKRVTLDLQGLAHRGSGRDELVWLSYTLWVDWAGGQPLTPEDGARYEGMRALRQIVEARLRELGYAVRPGRFVLDGGLKPINGWFECAEWYQEGKEWKVRAVGSRSDGDVPPEPGDHHAPATLGAGCEC